MTAAVRDDASSPDAKKRPRWHRYYWRPAYGLFALREELRAALWRFQDRHVPLGSPQATLTWEVPFPNVGDPVALVEWLRSRGIGVHEGVSAIYLPPEPALEALLPAICTFYPSGSGFKILKNFAHPSKVRYPGSRSLSHLLGGARNRLIAANYLHARGLGTRVLDLCAWTAGRRTYAVFVVEHAPGRPSPTDCAAFLEALHGSLAEGLLRVGQPHWQNGQDFRCPDCNGNLRLSADGSAPLYVDLESFFLPSPARWLGRLLAETGGALAPRREPPGWIAAVDLLARHGVGVGRRLVIDHTGSADIIRSALAAGAAWAIGEVAGARRRSLEDGLLAQGFTRFDWVGDPQVEDFESSLPPQLRSELAEAIRFGGGNEPRSWRARVVVGEPGETAEDLRPRLGSDASRDDTTVLTTTEPRPAVAILRTSR